MATAQIVFQPISRIFFDPVSASLELLGAIVVPAGENPTSDTRFRYTVGNPPAVSWMIEFFVSEADAEAGVNVLDVSGYLAYEIHPAKPIAAPPNTRQDGYLRLTRVGEIPYPRICVKFGICQPAVEEFENIGDPIETPLNLGEIPRRGNVYSDWRRR